MPSKETPMTRSTIIRSVSVFALALTLIALYFLSHLPSGPPVPEDLFTRRFVDEGGLATTLEKWKGRPVVLNFWATWCQPCIAEMPELQREQEQLSPVGVDIVGINTEDASTLREFRSRNASLRLPFLAGDSDLSGLLFALGDTQGALPYTVLVSADGRVLRTQLGRLSPGELSLWVRREHLDRRSVLAPG